MKKTGTHEWAVETINCTKGCINACNYCYARKILLAGGKINSPEEFSNIESNRNPTKEKALYSGVVMFPSMHDIFPENLEDCIATLKNLLAAGNKVLIVSKPRYDCITKLCNELSDYKDNILFRFTIGCRKYSILKIWEPNAPQFGERLASLNCAVRNGFKTSVSMEPALDPKRIVEDVDCFSSFVTNSIWIGKMNKIDQRVINVPRKNIEIIKKYQTDKHIKMIYEKLKGYPKVMWKDSIKQVIGIKQSEELEVF